MKRLDVGKDGVQPKPVVHMHYAVSAKYTDMLYLILPILPIRGFPRQDRWISIAKCTL